MISVHGFTSFHWFSIMPYVFLLLRDYIFIYAGSNFDLITLIQGSTVPLVVKWADTEKERQSRRAQKALFQASNAPDSGQHPSVFGALPMGYMPPYNGYGYQVGSLPVSWVFSY